jgi:hypothetical protein
MSCSPLIRFDLLLALAGIIEVTNCEGAVQGGSVR